MHVKNGYVGRLLCVEVWGRSTVWGTLASIDEDHVRLVDTIILGELEGHGWFEKMKYAQDDADSGPRNAEVIFRIGVVLHITCDDDDLPEPSLESPPDTDVSEVDPRSTNRLNRLEIEIGVGLIPLA